MIHVCVFIHTYTHAPVSVRMAVCVPWCASGHLGVISSVHPHFPPCLRQSLWFTAAYQTRSVDFWEFCDCLAVYQRSVRVADGYFCLQLYMSLWLQSQVLMLANKVSALPAEPSSHPSNHDVFLFLGAGD